MTNYDQFKIKTYNLWDLHLHEAQYPYIGRCYAWARREKAANVTDMTIAEREELFDFVIPAWDDAVKRLFKHDWPNLASLGNTSPHLHWHLIPRYHTPRNFQGIEFIDTNPTGNYAPYEKRTIKLETLLKIRDDIKQALP